MQMQSTMIAIRKFNILGSASLKCARFVNSTRLCSNANKEKDYDILHEENEDLKSKYKLILEENEEVKNKYKRALADLENYRKRSQRMIDETKIFAVQGFCKDLLEVADVLNMAIESLAEKQKEDSSLKNIYDGVSMTNNVLLKVFKKHGLVPVNPEGEKFDPNHHEAIFEVPIDQTKYKPGHIATVLKTGYSLHERPIRPAKVGVVKESS